MTIWQIILLIILSPFVVIAGTVTIGLIYALLYTCIESIMEKGGSNEAESDNGIPRH